MSEIAGLVFCDEPSGETSAPDECALDYDELSDFVEFSEWHSTSSSQARPFPDRPDLIVEYTPYFNAITVREDSNTPNPFGFSGQGLAAHPDPESVADHLASKVVQNVLPERTKAAWIRTENNEIYEGSYDGAGRGATTDYVTQYVRVVNGLPVWNTSLEVGVTWTGKVKTVRIHDIEVEQLPDVVPAIHSRSGARSTILHEIAKQQGVSEGNVFLQTQTIAYHLAPQDESATVAPALQARWSVRSGPAASKSRRGQLELSNAGPDFELIPPTTVRNPLCAEYDSLKAVEVGHPWSRKTRLGPTLYGLLFSPLAPHVACDAAGFRLEDERYVVDGIQPEDLLYKVGLREGDFDVTVRGLQPTETGVFPLESWESMLGIMSHWKFEISLKRPTESGSVTKSLYVEFPTQPPCVDLVGGTIQLCNESRDLR